MRKIIFNILILFFTTSTFGQSNLLNAVIPQDIGKLNEQQLATSDNKPLAYGYVDDRDVMWSKTVWEKIDLTERINFPYYYPVFDVDPTRKPLFDVLWESIKDSTITQIYKDGYFRDKETIEGVKFLLVYRGENDEGKRKVNAGIPREDLDPDNDFDEFTVERDAIDQYLIKGTWYFDKRLGELKYRLLGIAPVAVPASVVGNNELSDSPKEIEELLAVPLFWVWFPDARETLNKAEIFNSRNASQPITFDLMLNTRRFNSVIYKEENPFSDREIKDYIYEDALRQLLESERIKNVIRDYEQDMWNN
tara:strand:- start:1988 stop:2908 length:921 start_codon:yes stop_codon:yes gene_type:complete